MHVKKLETNKMFQKRVKMYVEAILGVWHEFCVYYIT